MMGVEGTSRFSPLRAFPGGFLCRLDESGTVSPQELVTWNLIVTSQSHMNGE